MANGRLDTKNWIPNLGSVGVLKIDGPEVANFEDQVKLFQAGEKDEVEFLRFRRPTKYYYTGPCMTLYTNVFNYRTPRL